jgi:integrase
VNTRQRLASVALEKGLRQSTVQSYERLMNRLGIMDMDPTQEEVLDRLFSIDNPNTRRAAVIALRSVFGWSIKIPKGIPRRYDLPDEDTLRLALMTSPHEARGLLMMYAGLRIGEACAITSKDLDGDRLRVDKQVQQLHRKGQETTCRLAPVKSSVAAVVVPDLLIPYIESQSETAKPDSVRESLRRAGSKVGIHLNPHQLRHWYASTLLERGAPISLVSRAMRHSDPSVTLRTYAQVRDEDIKKFF